MISLFFSNRTYFLIPFKLDINMFLQVDEIKLLRIRIKEKDDPHRRIIFLVIFLYWLVLVVLQHQ